MTEQKLDVIVKAIDLIDYTFTKTSNKKTYPPKYRMLIERLQSKSMDIYEYLMDANRLNIKTSKLQRIELQTKAITACDKLSCFVELSMKRNLISSDTVDYWQGKIDDVKYMTIGWREKDRVR